MKTASTLLQIAALGACLAMQFHAPGEFRMPGMRRALQTMALPGSVQEAGRASAEMSLARA